MAKKQNVNLDNIFEQEASKFALMTKTPRFPWLVIWFITFLFVSFLLWAYFGKINITASASGKVVGGGNVQLIQNLEGGIIDKVYVKEGQKVKAGELLVSLNTTGALADYHRETKRLAALKIKTMRLLAQSTNAATLQYPKALKKQYPELTNQAKEIFHNSKKQLKESLDYLNQAYHLTLQELKLIEPLVEERLISEVELLRLKKQMTHLKGQMLDKQNEAKAEILEELNKAAEEIILVEEQIKKFHDRLKRKKIHAITDGIIHQLYIDSPGEVVAPGVQIMSLVPFTQQLIIEALLPSNDIGFIELGQKAKVSINAYDFTVYGDLDATIETISPEVIVDKDGNSFYEVKLKTKTNYLQVKNKKLYIIPGMSAQIKIMTGERSILNYILKPVYKAGHSALQER